MPTDPPADHPARGDRDDPPAPEPAGTDHPAGDDDPTGDIGPPGDEPPTRPYAALGDTVTRALAGGRPPKHRRPLGQQPASAPRPQLVPPSGGKGMFPAAAALGAVLILSMVWVTALRDAGPEPVHGGGGPDNAQFSPAPPPSQSSAGQGRAGASGGETATGAGSNDSPCPRPLAVTASPDIAALVRELAAPLAGGGCTQVAVTAEAPESTLSTLADGGAAPDVWIPASTLSLRMATAGDGRDLPTSGTSVATSPIVVAMPQPVHDEIAGPNVLPAWRMLYTKVTGGEIERMTMPDPDSTVGALALLSMQQAMTDSYDDQAFLRALHFRGQLAGTEAEVDALLRDLAASSPERAGTDVGVFPATEQQLLDFNDGDPPVPVHLMGTYDATSEADYPLAVSAALDDRLDQLATDLLAELRSPGAVERLVAAGFRPARDATTRPSALADTDRFPDGLPDPVPLPSAGQWREIVDAWRADY